MSDLINKVANAIDMVPSAINVAEQRNKETRAAIEIILNDLLENGPKGPLTAKERFLFNELIIAYAKENGIDIF